jgi:hypothetical protein
MTQEEINEGNKLIAEFVNPEKHSTGLFYRTAVGKPWLSPYQMCYHSSFDWLMPVVEKIEALDYRVEIYDCYCDIYAPSNVQKDAYTELIATSKNESKNKIEATWYAVVQFIKWYNTQQ